MLITDKMRESANFVYQNNHARSNANYPIALEIYKNTMGNEILFPWELPKEIIEEAEKVNDILFAEYLEIEKTKEFFRTATKSQIMELYSQKDWRKFLGIETKNLFLEFEPEEDNILVLAMSENISASEVLYYTIFEREV